MPSSILGHADWRAHRHCELEPDLRSPPCARVIANQHRGLEVLGMRTWSLRPGELSLKQAKAAFARLKLDNAYPLARLSQWKARAWEKAANAGLSDAVLETQLKLYSPFIRKLALHDLWLPHRCGQEDSTVVGTGAPPILVAASQSNSRTDASCFLGGPYHKGAVLYCRP
ncbi:unnamed protein product [Symbiodinium necroappetens]|uniref:Uncharacterized protein n=1 Tax=Symbiodinium necroappetens TaxID=1628268 RepID=A0A812V6M5_9DINO|nr:unnamed protein product [Symbiodinium necroappetens]